MSLEVNVIKRSGEGRGDFNEREQSTADHYLLLISEKFVRQCCDAQRAKVLVS